MKVFNVDGFWNDDKTRFYDLFVAEYDNTPAGWDDDQIFFYGLNEDQLLGEHEDFTITAYGIYEEEQDDNTV